jgi:hypothetical protein
MRFVFEPERPEAKLVSNVRWAGFVGDRVVAVDTERFGPRVRGGVLEPGEEWTDALKRRAPRGGRRAAAVGRVMSCLPCWSGSMLPDRPHLPDPDFR